MKSLILLWKTVLAEAGTMCGVCTTRSETTAARREEHEGLPFYTITLPAFCTDVFSALELGAVTHDHFVGFSRRGGLPKFLGEFLEQVFDRDSGELLTEPSVDALCAIRQICLLLQKVEIEPTEIRRARAMKGFDECEQQVKEEDQRRCSTDVADLHRIFLLLFADTLAAAENFLAANGVVPRHGPGAVVEGVTGNAKYSFDSWPERLESVFPSGEFAVPGPRFVQDLDRVDLLEPGAEQPVRVITVPKTQKTPRVIAIEPLAMQYCQQGMRELLTELLHRRRVPGHTRTNLPHLFISLNDQGPNQAMAAQGSLYGHLATLDLSEASDRVSYQLVRSLFERFPYVWEHVDACRSTRADVDGQIINLAKFASMGSALTFPIETMVFLAVAFHGIFQELNSLPRRTVIKQFASEVRVYGDDIVVPTAYAPAVMRSLETFGLKVNRSKSFWKGPFRESCGGDFVRGHWITPVRVHHALPTTAADSQEIASAIALRNNLYYAGWWQTARWMDDQIHRVISHYPTVHPGSPVQGRWTLLDYQVDRVCPNLHRPLVRGFVSDAKPPVNELDGTGALLKFFLKRGDEPHEKGHLKRSGRPKHVALKLGWGTPY